MANINYPSHFIDTIRFGYDSTKGNMVWNKDVNKRFMETVKKEYLVDKPVLSRGVSHVTPGLIRNEKVILSFRYRAILFERVRCLVYDCSDFVSERFVKDGAFTLDPCIHAYTRKIFINGRERELVIPAEKIYNKEESKEMEKFYNTTVTIDGTETEIFGKVLTYNTDGKAVFEQRGTNEIFVVEPDAVIRVLPHTIAVIFEPGGQEYHFRAPKDRYNVGDMLIRTDRGSNYNSGFPIVQVVAVDTKNEGATREFEGVRISESL